MFGRKSKEEKALDVLKKASIGTQREAALILKQAGDPSVFASSQSSATQSRLASNDQQMKQMSTLDIIFACVRYHQTAFQEGVPRLQKRTEGDHWQPVPDSSIEMAFKSNTSLSASLIKQYQVGHLQTTGKSFTWVISDGFGEVQEVWPIPPSWVQIVTKAQDGSARGNNVISHFKVTPSDGVDAGGQQPGTWELEVDEVAYTRFPAPWNLWDGVSPVNTAYPKIEMEQMSEGFTKKSLDNLNVPGLVVKTQKRMTDPQKNDLRAVLRAKLGADMSESAIYMSGEHAELQILNPLSEFEWEDFHNLSESRICSVFGVHPILVGLYVGLSESSGWAAGDIREARKSFYRNTVAGLWKMFSDDLTRIVIPPEQRNDYRIFYDYSEVMEMQEDKKDLEERAIRLFNASMITLNESRDMQGLPGVAQGDVFKTALNTMFLGSGSDLTLPPGLGETDTGTDNEGGTPESLQGQGQSPTVGTYDQEDN
jgi:phage portal protein BeeE